MTPHLSGAGLPAPARALAASAACARSLHRKARPGTAGADGYTREFAEAFCARIAAGETMSGICGRGGWPPRSTVYGWINGHGRFAAMYARAQIWAMRRGARAMAYSIDVGEAVAERYAGGEPLSRICRDPDMPAHSTVNAWRRKYPEFETLMAIARDTVADLFVEKVVEAVEAATTETVAPTRLRVQAYKWAAAKTAPRRYGWMPAEVRTEPYDDLSWLAARYDFEREAVVGPPGG